ncbi:MAG: TMEM165/GDT1 family protein [Elusimicrobia bacterium]|nr:TMEM165/GDT1 family protein [Elusimicrobiota bacterium]MDE2424475.1 TMEM165/GDT1 family protein [Elusimicrobiota bacterium]
MSFHFDPTLFASVFGVIFVAELPDKTAFATLIMATRKHPVAIFCGAAVAFVVQSLIAVSLGSALSLLPREPVRIAAGLLFWALAIAMWVRKEAEEEDLHLPTKDKASFWRTVWTSFVVIFIAEWGDLTQFATATLAARHRAPLTIFFAATLALWAVTAIAVALGHRAKAHINPRLLQRIAAVAFVAVGAMMLATAGGV